MAYLVDQSWEEAQRKTSPRFEFDRPDRSWARRVDAGIRLLARTPLTMIGEFRCRVTYPGFREFGNPTKTYVIAFPSHPVGISKSGGNRFVADPGLAVFYNPGQEFLRREVSPDGDHSWLIRLDPGIAREIAIDVGFKVDESNQRWFPSDHGPISTRTILRQRALVRSLLEADAPDFLEMEQTIIDVAHQAALDAAAGVQLQVPRRHNSTLMAHRDLVHSTKEFVGRRFTSELLLEDIAEGVHSSPFHLCRVFRAQTGMSIHRYVMRLRLCRALDLLADWHGDLSLLAAMCNFSHHSHLTNAFRREFGITPSQAKSGQLAELAFQMSKKLQA